MRLRDSAPAPTGELPDELTVCYVEDWADDGDVFTAWRRWRQARRAWVDEHGLDHRQCASSSAPRWRSCGHVVGSRRCERTQEVSLGG